MLGALASWISEKDLATLLELRWLPMLMSLSSLEVLNPELSLCKAAGGKTPF
jgi:hypothetical protein